MDITTIEESEHYVIIEAPKGQGDKENVLKVLERLRVENGLRLCHIKDSMHGPSMMICEKI